MKITKKEVEYAADLARLELGEEEKEKFAGQLESILEYMGKLNSIDTSGIEPTSHASMVKNVFRKDEVVECSEERRQKILNNAPEREGDFFKVKKVIE